MKIEILKRTGWICAVALSVVTACAEDDTNRPPAAPAAAPTASAPAAPTAAPPAAPDAVPPAAPPVASPAAPPVILPTASPATSPAYRPLSLSVEAGTVGVGGAVAFRFMDHLGVRGGFDYFTYSGSYTFEGVPYESTFRPMSEVLTLNIYPWKKSSFYISLGALFNQNQLTGTASDANGITLDGTTYPPGQVGTLHLKIDQQPVNPYLSIGGNFFYFDKAHHWSMGGELGVAYAGEPQVSLTRSGGVPSSTIDAAVKQTQQQIADNARPFQIWPVLKLQVTCSF